MCCEALQCNGHLLRACNKSLFMFCFRNGGKYDVHGSVNRNINLIETNNKMRPCSRIYYSNIS
jgi:hypothetical protein